MNNPDNPIAAKADFDTIFMTGPQGSGKGTQAKRLAEKLGFFHWDMGAILRGVLQEGDTPLAKKVEVINQGVFLTDEVIIEVSEDRLKKIPRGQGIIFDGIPRRPIQARFLIDFLREQQRRQPVTLLIDVPRAVSVERILSRAKIEGRVDDTPEMIDKRLQFYEEVILPLMDMLKEETRFITVDGTPSVEEVEQRIDAALGI